MDSQNVSILSSIDKLSSAWGLVLVNVWRSALSLEENWQFTRLLVSLNHCVPGQQQTLPVYASVFQTCLFLGREFHLCCSSRQQCPDGPSEEMWQTPSGTQLLCMPHQNYRDANRVVKNKKTEPQRHFSKTMSVIVWRGWDTYRLYLPMLLRSASWLSVTWFE